MQTIYSHLIEYILDKDYRIDVWNGGEWFIKCGYQEAIEVVESVEKSDIHIILDNSIVGKAPIDLNDRDDETVTNFSASKNDPIMKMWFKEWGEKQEDIEEKVSPSALRKRESRQALKDQGLVRLTGNSCYIHPGNKKRAEKFLLKMRKLPKYPLKMRE